MKKEKQRKERKALKENRSCSLSENLNFDFGGGFRIKEAFLDKIYNNKKGWPDN